MKAYWTLELKGTAQCVNDFQLMVAGAVSNTISEIIVASLPIFAVFKLHVAKNQRWTVITLFSMNFLVAIAGICRIYYLALTLTTWDLNWYANPQWICSLIEIDVALVCPVFSFRVKKWKMSGLDEESLKARRRNCVLEHTNYFLSRYALVDLLYCLWPVDFTSAFTLVAKDFALILQKILRQALAASAAKTKGIYLSNNEVGCQTQKRLRAGINSPPVSSISKALAMMG